MINILGAGGHAQVVADILALQGQEFKFYDDGLPQYPPIAEANGDFIVAIGDNLTRENIYKKQLGMAVNAIHPSSVIADNVKIGRGVVICAGVVVNPNVIISDNVILNTGCIIEHDCMVDYHAHIAPGAILCGNVFIGNGALVGANSVVTPGAIIPFWSLVKAGSVWK